MDEDATEEREEAIGAANELFDCKRAMVFLFDLPLPDAFAFKEDIAAALGGDVEKGAKELGRFALSVAVVGDGMIGKFWWGRRGSGRKLFEFAVLELLFLSLVSAEVLLLSLSLSLFSSSCSLSRCSSPRSEFCRNSVARRKRDSTTPISFSSFVLAVSAMLLSNRTDRTLRCIIANSQLMEKASL